MRTVVVLAAALLVSAALADTAAPPPAPTAPAAPSATAAAPKMKTYYFALLTKGPAWTPERTAEVMKLQEGHMANIRRLADEGKLIVAGPFVDGGDWRGIFVFKGSSVEEVKGWCASDPAVQAGRLAVEVKAWMVEEGSFTRDPRP